MFLTVLIKYYLWYDFYKNKIRLQSLKKTVMDGNENKTKLNVERTAVKSQHSCHLDMLLYFYFQVIERKWFIKIKMVLLGLPSPI